MSGADLIHEAREFQQKFSPHGWEGSLVGRLAGWEGSLVGRLADALEAAEALAEVRNPPPEYYAETLAEGQEEIARLEADNAALLGVARWMSGSSSFGPEGEARVGWEGWARPVLNADHPGESLLREIGALRAVAEESKKWMDWLGPDAYEVRLAPLRAALAAWEAVRRG